MVGVLVMQFHMVTEAGQMVRTKQLCYVCTKVDKIYMSKQGLQQLGIIGQNFPLPPSLTSVTSVIVHAPPDPALLPHQLPIQAS